MRKCPGESEGKKERMRWRDKKAKRDEEERVCKENRLHEVHSCLIQGVKYKLKNIITL